MIAAVAKRGGVATGPTSGNGFSDTDGRDSETDTINQKMYQAPMRCNPTLQSILGSRVEREVSKKTSPERE